MPRPLSKPDETYKASDDTFLLADTFLKRRFGRALEIGVGEGFITTTLARQADSVVGTDINIEAIRKTRRRLVDQGLASNVDLMVCDGADAVNWKFDICVFNPPYLPSDIDDITVAGGEEGIETTKRWFDQCTRLLNDKARIFFVASNLANLDALLQHIDGRGFEANIIAKKKLFFEEIFVIQANVRGQLKG